ncbi:hypothetical protein KC799_07880, partial [candidate division KSB1 bacterium]|nr:hypothetical protein [candidate division KSB1 bacterium]
PGINAQCREMLPIDNQLFVASSNGVYVIENEKADLVISSERGFPLYFHRSSENKNRLYFGSNGGLGLIEFHNGEWKFAKYSTRITEMIEHLAEDEHGALWLTNRLGEILQLSKPFLHFSAEDDASTIRIERIGEQHGLAKGWSKPVAIGNKFLFTTPKGLRRFDSENSTFPLDSSFAGLFADTTWNFSGRNFEFDALGRILTSNSGRYGFATPQPDGSYTWNTTPFLRLADLGDFWTFYIDEKYKSVYWFGGAEGIARYDETVPTAFNARYPTIIRRVMVARDSIIYGGAYTNPDAFVEHPALSYDDNTVRIEYAAPYFENESTNQYQYVMDGFEKGWSDWTNETFVDYRQLPEGQYTFRVRARNVYHKVGEEAIYTFKIKPPWYRTWWSYVLYGVFIFGGLFAFDDMK